MKERLALWVFVSAVALAHAESFEARVELAKAAELREEFRSYQPAMFARAGDHLAYTMRSCFAKTAKPEADPFVLVADITQAGKVEGVQVKPVTIIARCFAAGFGSAAHYIAVLRDVL